MPNDDDDLEPLPLPGGPAPARPSAGSGEDATTAAVPSMSSARPTVVRDRFLVGLAVVAAIAIVALAVQLRSIARDAAHDAACSEALVAVVSSPSRTTSSELRQRLESQLRSCLGPDATLPGFGTGTQ